MRIETVEGPCARRPENREPGADEGAAGRNGTVAEPAGGTTDMATRLLQDLGAAAMGALVRLGDRLGLFRELARSGPLTAAQLAARTATDARLVREWLAAAAASSYVEHLAAAAWPDDEPGDGSDGDRFWMTPGQAAALADPDSPTYMLGGYSSLRSLFLDEDRIVEAYRSGGGMAWGEHHPCLFEGSANFYRPTYQHQLVQSWLPAISCAERRLRAGARVADVGCGFGFTTLLMAEAYPASTFVGIEPHEPSRLAATARAERAGLTNVRFLDGDARSYRERFDLVMFFDCLHDMGDPVGALRHARSRLTDGGAVIVVEPSAGDRLADNLNPVGRAFYAFSATVCTPAGQCGDVGLALGAQAGERRLREILVEAGFACVTRTTQTPFTLVLHAV